MSFTFGEGMRASPSTAWLDDDEDVSLFVSFAVAESENAVVDGRIVTLLDNVQVPVRAEAGVAGPFVAFDLRAGETKSARFSISSSEVAAGAHSLVVAVISAATGRMLGGSSFTVFKDGFDFSTRSDHTADEAVEVRARRDYYWTPTSNGFSLGLYEPFPGVPEGGGLVPVEMTIQLPESDYIAACSRLPVSMSVVAFVDGEQAQLGDFGYYLRVLIKYDQAAFVSTEVALPQDGQAHTLTLLAYYGDGFYGETPEGLPTPWYDGFLRDFGFAYWE